MTLIVNNTTIDNIIVRDRTSGVETPLDLFQDSNGVEIWSAFKKLEQLIDGSIESITAEDLNGVVEIGSYAVYDCKNLTQVSFPSSVTSIGNHSFFDCKNLTQVSFPSSVTSIGDYSFNDCENLTQLSFPSSVTSIGNYAFNKCYKLSNLTLAEGLITIGSGVFGNTILTEVTIPSTVTTIGVGIFNSGNLKTIRMLPTTPPSIFGIASSVERIEVPINSLSAYQTADGWKSVASVIVGV